MRTRESATRRPRARRAGHRRRARLPRRGQGRESADRLRSAGIKEVEAIRFDVNRSEDHQAIFHHLDKRFGKLDILVNNAGIWLESANFGAPGGLNTTTDVTPDILKNTFETNFFAVVALTQVLLPLVARPRPAGS